MENPKNRANARQTDDENLTSSLPVSVSTDSPVAAGNSSGVLPALVVEAGAAASFAWEEFIYAKIRNPHTRAAYERAIRQFVDGG